MIRQPSIDIIKLMKQINWSLPPLKVVLCKYFNSIILPIFLMNICIEVPAEAGVGMTLCLFHVIHYAFRKKMLLVNTPTGIKVIYFTKKKTLIDVVFLFQRQKFLN